MKKERIFLASVFLLAPFVIGGLSNEVNAQPLPDLGVTKIECAPPQNKLAFEVVNKSNVPLPAGWKAVADVYFDGVKKGFFDLGRPTSGDITPAGGSAYYLVVYDIVKPVAVKVVADATNSISESNERNNELTKRVVPCGQPKPEITGYREKCGQKGSNVTILGRNFGAREGKSVALGGHGIHVDLPVISWSDTLILAQIPDDPRIQEGQWYYIGVERADHGEWLSNINKNISICKELPDLVIVNYK